MRIFVTGGTGFIGSHFLHEALSEGHDLVAIKRKNSEPRIPLGHEPRWVEGDLEADYSEELSGCDTLVHLAGYGVDPKDSDWQESFRWNVDASLQLWLSAINAGVKRLVICGSCFEYGKSGEGQELISTTTPLLPQSSYAASKAAASMLAVGLAASKNVEVVILRPFHVFGEGESAHRLWPSLRKSALAGEDFKMTKGEQIRDFIPVEKVVKDILNAVDSELLNTGAVIKNVGTGKPQSILEFSKFWWDHFEAKGKLLIGAIDYRENEVMRYVPQIDDE